MVVTLALKCTNVVNCQKINLYVKKEFIMKKVIALFFIALLSTAYAEAQDVNGCHANVKVYECR